MGIGKKKINTHCMSTSFFFFFRIKVFHSTAKNKECKRLTVSLADAITKDISKSVPFWPNSEIPIQKIPCFFGIVFGLFFDFFVGGEKNFSDMSSGLSPGVIWGPELSPRKSGRCARFARATPCQCREAWRFLPSDAQKAGGEVNHNP